MSDAPQTPPEAEAITRQSILVIDDDILIRDMFLGFLGKAGYRVVVAGDGFRALDLYSKNQGKFDLIISDFAMAGMDVLQIYKRMNEAGSVPKFLVCSGAPKAYGNPELISAGITDFLRKPFTVPEMLEMVARLLPT